MAIPQWLAISLAVLVLTFGCYRIWLAVGGPSDEERAKARSGMLAMSRRSNGMVAILYLLVGGALLASAFGWRPWRGSSTTTTTEPAPGPGSAILVR